MRIPNYLRLAPSGIWHFRQGISFRQARKAGKAEITQSLSTHDLLTAQQRALDLAQAYAQRITVRGLSVSVARDNLLPADEIARAIALGYKPMRHPDGTVELEANGKASHGFAMEAVDRIRRLDQEPYYQELMRSARAAAPNPDPASKIPVIAIGKVVKVQEAHGHWSNCAKTWEWVDCRNPCRRVSVRWWLR